MMMTIPEDEFKKVMCESVDMGFKFGADCVLDCVKAVMPKDLFEILLGQIQAAEAYKAGAAVITESKDYEKRKSG